MKDFYIILPSNSCPLIFPDNEASKFNVEFQNPIYLDGEWEVALMDFTFVYNTFPYYSNSLIQYEKVKMDEEIKYFRINNSNRTFEVIYPTNTPIISNTHHLL